MPTTTSRRAALRAAAAPLIVRPQLVRGAGKEKVRAGLVGCGGRGTAAIVELMAANENVELVAMADVFEDKLETSLRGLREGKTRVNNYVGGTILRDGKPHKLTKEEIVERLINGVKVAPDHRFVGQDAYRKLLQTEIDVVLLITPPGHRPPHFEAAVEARKHVFIEKPVATDPVGTRRVMDAARRSRELKLTVLAGTESRYSYQTKETVERIHAGAIGDIVSLYSYYMSAPVFHVQKREPHWSEVDWQHRNWYSFVWICGDQLVEQAVHQVDLLNWVMRSHPVKAIGTGGRAWRRDGNPLHGNIYDHMTVEFTYPNGVKMLSVIRHYPRLEHVATQIGSEVMGTKGRSNTRDLATSSDGLVAGLAEQTLLINSIRGDGPYFNNAMDVAESTMSCVMGREAAYSGQVVTWEDALNSDLSIVPAVLDFDRSYPINLPDDIPHPGMRA